MKQTFAAILGERMALPVKEWLIQVEIKFRVGQKARVSTEQNLLSEEA